MSKCIQYRPRPSKTHETCLFELVSMWSLWLCCFQGRPYHWVWTPAASPKMLRIKCSKHPCRHFPLCFPLILLKRWWNPQHFQDSSCVRKGNMKMSCFIWCASHGTAPDLETGSTFLAPRSFPRNGFPGLLLEKHASVFKSLKIHLFRLKHVLRKHHILNLILFSEHPCSSYTFKHPSCDKAGVAIWWRGSKMLRDTQVEWSQDNATICHLKNAVGVNERSVFLDCFQFILVCQ